MSEPDADPSELAVRLAALSDEQLLAVLSVVTSGRPGLAEVYEVVTRLLARTGATGPNPDVIPDTPISTGYQSSSGGRVSPQVGGGFSADTGVTDPGGGDLGGYGPDGVPTFESVRDKVEQRFGTAQGMSELDRRTPAGRGVDEQWEAREQAARERLEQIRKSVRGERGE
ncbi:hypothetical protein [Nocardia paucivorans]|uniref:hypothetical protein n=1 Tax=Nocardia paucivorans TaxID=114259 RepID=UPI0002FD89F7|nr:hypothetical protein [Nocardia paucivorans]